MKIIGRYAIDAITTYAYSKKWVSKLSPLDIVTLGNALHIFHTSVTSNKSKAWDQEDLKITQAAIDRAFDHIPGTLEPLMPDNSILRVLYDYYPDFNSCPSGYKTTLREGVGANSSNTFKDRYRRNSIPLQLSELYGSVMAVSPFLKSSPSKNQFDFQQGVTEFVTQVSIGLNFLETEICNNVDQKQILQLLHFYASNI